MLKLKGVVSSVYGNKIYMGGHAETLEKLTRFDGRYMESQARKLESKDAPVDALVDAPVDAPVVYKSPIKDDKFYAILPKDCDAKGIDLGKINGSKITIWAYTKKYSFKSTRDGDASVVTGWNLHIAKVAHEWG
jgi:hypothetical protein